MGGSVSESGETEKFIIRYTRRHVPVPVAIFFKEAEPSSMALQWPLLDELHIAPSEKEAHC